MQIIKKNRSILKKDHNRIQWCDCKTILTTSVGARIPPTSLPSGLLRSMASVLLTGGNVSKCADGGGWQEDKKELVLVSLLLYTGCGRVNCWHEVPVPGGLEGLAADQKVLEEEEEKELQGWGEEQKVGNEGRLSCWYMVSSKREMVCVAIPSFLMVLKSNPCL